MSTTIVNKDWEDFKRQFKEAGNAVEEESEDDEIVMYRPYRIINIRIINGRAKIRITPFALRPETSRAITTFSLSSDTTKLNLAHLKRSQTDENFRYEIISCMHREFLIGEYSVYSVQVGDRRLRFK